jgi:hypothetical protein
MSAIHSSCFDEAEGDTNRNGPRIDMTYHKYLMMKLLARLSIIFQYLSWFELRPLEIAELQHPVNELLVAGDVQHAERSA